MNRLLFAVPAAGSLLAVTLMLTPKPAVALPTCEQEINIRCHGYSVQNRPRLDLDYSSPEECVRIETPLNCGTNPDFDQFSALLGRDMRETALG